jgi:outer membrane lipoprotein carrier protein
MKKYLAALWLTLSPLWAGAQSATAIDELLSALDEIQQLQGSFEQRQYGENDVLLVQSSGTFRLLRPGYFAWEIAYPDSQLIIATPEFVWHHDRDLETVTRRPVNDSAQMSPLQVLGGDESVLRDKFTVERAGAGAYSLVPRSADVGFKRLTLRLDGARIEGMEILDSLNQRVVIDFAQLDAKAGLSSADFAFSPPDGVDLFYYDE